LEFDDENKKEKNELVEWIKSIAIAILIAILIKTFVFNTTYVVGNSMYPTLHDSDRLIAFKLPLYFTDPKPGDIVILSAPDSENKDYIKRVIAVEGDIVQISDGKIYVNGVQIEENYLTGDEYTHIYSENYWIIPEGEVFVLGDNRAEGASKDSRYFGTVKIEDIKGIAKFRYYPFDSRFGKLN
jgi:signal peptidase I